MKPIEIVNLIRKYYPVIIALVVAVLSLLPILNIDISVMARLNILMSLVAGLFFAIHVDQNSRLDKIQRLIEQSLGVIFINGQRAIYDTVTEILSSATEEIRVVMLGTRPRSPKEVMDTLIEILRAGIRYEIIRIVPSHDITEQVFEVHDIVLNKMKEIRLDKRYFLRIIENDNALCFDVVIVDDKHCMIAFSRNNDSYFENAMCFKDNFEITRHFQTWFDKVVLPRSISVVDWKTKHNRQ